MDYSIKQVLQQASQQLDACSDSARLDADLLVAHVLQVSRSYLMTWPEKQLSKENYTQLQVLLKRRCAGEPVAYLLGMQEFWSLALKVTADTLVPRADTEVLIEQVLQLYPDQSAKLKLLDLGTGTGAIALALASEYPQSTITATDRMPAALAVAQENANHLNLPIQCIESMWFSALTGQKFDCIVSNPPYICENDPHLSEQGVCREPLTALIAGEDGLDDIRELATEAPRYLYPNGWLLVEHGYHQGQAVRELFIQHGFQSVETRQDYAGVDRMTFGQV